MKVLYLLKKKLEKINQVKFSKELANLDHFVVEPSPVLLHYDIIACCTQLLCETAHFSKKFMNGISNSFHIGQTLV